MTKPAAEWLDPRSLKPWSRNPRRNRHAVDEVARSIRRFGFGAPIVARREDRRIIAGHTRHAAALQEGLEEVPVRLLDVTESEADALALADNKLGEIARWDEDALAEVLADLESAGEPLDGIGFSTRELDDLVEGLGGSLASEVGGVELEAAGTSEGDDEQDEAPVDSRAGRIYRLGAHRLAVGDSTDPAVVEALLEGDQAEVMIFDPPFDEDYDRWSVPRSVRLLMVWGEGANALRWVARRVGPGGWSLFELAFSGMARGRWRPSHPCQVHYSVPVLRRGEDRGFVRPEPARRMGLRTTSDGRPFSFYPDLLQSRREWDKPAACYAPFLCFSRPGETVLDPTAGSGSSLIASAAANLSWRGVEVKPRWADHARRAWTAWAEGRGVDPGPDALA